VENQLPKQGSNSQSASSVVDELDLYLSLSQTRTPNKQTQEQVRVVDSSDGRVRAQYECHIHTGKMQTVGLSTSRTTKACSTLPTQSRGGVEG
jgi:hypothetical protein